MAQSNPLDDYRNLPVIGPWIGKFGRVQEIMSRPCEISPEIWALAYFHSLPKLAWSLFKPDPIDATYARLGRPHRRRRNGRMRETNFLTMDAPGFRKGFQWAVFRLGNIAQRVGWYMIVVDAAFDLAINWTSTAYEFAGCDPDAGGHCLLAAPAWPVFAGETGRLLFDFASGDPTWNGVDSVNVPAGLAADVNFSLKVSPFAPIPGPIPTVEAFLKVNDFTLDGTAVTFQGGGPGTAGERHSAMRTSLRGFVREYELHYRATGAGVCDLGGTTLYAADRRLSERSLFHDPP